MLIYSVRELLFCFSNILFITFGVAAGDEVDNHLALTRESLPNEEIFSGFVVGEKRCRWHVHTRFAIFLLQLNTPVQSVGGISSGRGTIEGLVPDKGQSLKRTSNISSWLWLPFHQLVSQFGMSSKTEKGCGKLSVVTLEYDFLQELTVWW